MIARERGLSEACHFGEQLSLFEAFLRFSRILMSS